MKEILRRGAKRRLSANLRFAVRAQVSQWRTHGPAGFFRWNAMCAQAWLRDRLTRHRYQHLSEAEARASRKSDTVFIFGCGSSLNDLTSAEWAHFAAHDVFGFNAFYYQRHVPVGFHLLRSGIYGELRWRPFAQEVSEILRENACFANTIFVMQEEYIAHYNNQMVGYGFLPPTARVLRYVTAREDGPPTRSLAEGLRHDGGTLFDSVNCAFCLGWKHIVLVGIDLYDSRYFYLPPDQTPSLDPDRAVLTGGEFNSYRGNRFDEPHNTLRLGVIDRMDEWRALLEHEGVRLSVYNPRSLLAAVLPVYGRPTEPVPASPGLEVHK